MTQTGNGVRVVLALIPTSIGVLFVGIGAFLFIPAQGFCSSSGPLPNGCPNLPVNYPLASSVLGIGLVLTVMGVVVLIRQLLYRRRFQPERGRNHSSQQGPVTSGTTGFASARGVLFQVCG
jgi:hypothetical protein